MVYTHRLKELGARRRSLLEHSLQLQNFYRDVAEEETWIKYVPNQWSMSYTILSVVYMRSCILSSYSIYSCCDLPLSSLFEFHNLQCLQAVLNILHDDIKCLYHILLISQNFASNFVLRIQHKHWQFCTLEALNLRMQGEEANDQWR